MSEDTPAKKAIAQPVGSIVDGLKKGATVVRPNGDRHTVHGRTYVLDAPGTFDIDGQEYTVK